MLVPFNAVFLFVPTCFSQIISQIFQVSDNIPSPPGSPPGTPSAGQVTVLSSPISALAICDVHFSISVSFFRQMNPWGWGHGLFWSPLYFQNLAWSQYMLPELRNDKEDVGRDVLRLSIWTVKPASPPVSFWGAWCVWHQCSTPNCSKCFTGCTVGTWTLSDWVGLHFCLCLWGTLELLSWDSSFADGTFPNGDLSFLCYVCQLLLIQHRFWNFSLIFFNCIETLP